MAAVPVHRVYGRRRIRFTSLVYRSVNLSSKCRVQMHLPQIALDFGGLDSPELGEGGQLRYCVDLVRGLAELKAPARFLVLGARPEPVPALKAVFVSSGGQ